MSKEYVDITEKVPTDLCKAALEDAVESLELSFHVYLMSTLGEEYKPDKHLTIEERILQIAEDINGMT